MTVTTTENDLRQLVTIETIRAVDPIVDADAIEAATVRGWTVVVKKGEFAVGDRVLYFEIDSALPMADDRFAFLAPRGTKTLEDGAVVHRLTTARLRGVYSQGLAMPLADFPEVTAAQAAHQTGDPGDLAALLGVTKYEPPLPVGMDIVGEFTRGLATKTDSERAQNLTDQWDELLAAGPWLATEKVDGTSLTVARDGDDLRVCSRNYEIGEGNNPYWNAVRATGIGTHLAAGEVLQGEIVGPGIRKKNPLGLTQVLVVVFTFTRDGVVLDPDQWPTWITEAEVAPRVLPVPVYDLALPGTAAEAVALVDGIGSLVAPGRKAEGIVWHRVGGQRMNCLGGRSTFKTISNSYVLKHGD